MNLNGKVAFVTGGSSGIGKASAIRFAEAGAKVAIMARSPEETRAAADEIGTRNGGGAIAVLGDVSKVEDVERCVRETVEKFGRLDVVMANAGVNGVWAPIEEIEPEEFDKTVAINLRGTFLTIRASVPHLRMSGGGSIVVVSSINGTRTFSNTGATPYATTKAGQLAMAQMLAVELAKDHIRVNVICPGAIESDINEHTEKRDLDKVKVRPGSEMLIPLNANKSGKASQVADVALFLASDASSHVTGSPIWVDGAQSLLI